MPLSQTAEMSVSLGGEAPSGESFVLWGDRIRCLTRDRVLLETSSVALKSGQLSVILGPSGVGKTTLLNVLTGRVKPDEGQVGINDEEMSDPISKYLINYVMAHDRLNEYLTVEETLLLTAQLKLPHKTLEECKAAAYTVMQQLNILHCAHTLVGGAWRKGISKGETKRLAVACELLGSPSCITLDEPTSGLDSSISYELIKILKNVAVSKNMIVLCTLHQPNQRIFDMIDCLIVMGGSPGRILYQGPPHSAVPFLKSRGLTLTNMRDDPQSPTSVPDLILDLVVGGTDANTHGMSDLSQFDSEDMFCPCILSDKSSLVSNSRRPDERRPRRLSAARRTHNEIINQIVPQQCIVENEYGPLQGMEYIKQITDAQSWGSQFHVCLKNQFKSNRRNPITVLIILLVNIIQSVLLGFIMFQVNSDMKSVTATNYLDWPIFQSAPLRFLAYGLTNSENTSDKVDPIENLLKTGPNTVTQKSMPMELAANVEFAQWISEFTKCFRGNFFVKETTEASGEWPRWDYTNFNSHQATMQPDYDAGFGDVCWNDVNAYNDTRFGHWSLNQAVTTIVSVAQMVDLTLNHAGVITVPKAGQESTSWLGFSMGITDLVNSGLCCAGNEIGFATLLPQVCSKIYKTHKLPLWPGRMYWPDYKQELADFRDFLIYDLFENMAEAQADLEKNALSLTDEDAASKSSQGMFSTFQNIVHLLGKSSDTLRLRRENNKASEPPAGNEPFTADEETASAPKRRLGSGLAGMVTDMIRLLTENPNTPLYKVIMSIKVVYAKISSGGCKTAYCDMITNYVTSSSQVGTDLFTTLLTILNICSVIFFLVANLGFSSYDILLQFPQLRAIFNRERANGMYRTSSFLLAKMIADLPFHLIPGLVWALIYWFMTGLDSQWLKVIQYCGVAALISFTSYSLGYFVSSVCLHLEVSVVLSPMILVCMLVLAGFFLRDAEMPGWIAWARYLSIYRWGYFAVSLIQFPPDSTYGPVPNSLSLMLAGVTDQKMWRVCLYLVLISLGCRLACYGCLRYLYTSQGKQA